jgi:hypothetical protein
MLSCFFCHKNEDGRLLCNDYDLQHHFPEDSLHSYHCKELKSVAHHLLESWKAVAYVQSHISVQQGYKIPGIRFPGRLNCIWWCPMFLDPQLGTCFMLISWYLQFWSGFCTGEICGLLLYSVLNVFQDLLELGHRTFGLWVRCGFCDCRMWPV